MIGFHAPKTPSLLQGQIKELTDAGKKRKTRASAVDPSAAKKKTKKQQAKPADDLPNVEPDIEEALDEAEMEEAVDEAVAELSDVGEKKHHRLLQLLRKHLQLLLLQLYLFGNQG